MGKIKKKTPLPLVIIGFIVMIGVPLAFFIFGWRTLDITCRRTGPSALCRVEEHFAAGLYTSHITAADVIDVGYKTSSSRSSGRSYHTVYTSTVAFQTLSGHIPVSEVSSNVDDKAKKELIQTFRSWFAYGEDNFVHHSNLISVFGWIGAIGMAFWCYVVLSLPYYWFKKKRGSK